MNAKHNTKSGLTIEQQIQSIHMPPHERAQVLHDARLAEAFVEVFTWVGSKFNRPVAGVFAKPSPKY